MKRRIKIGTGKTNSKKSKKIKKRKLSNLEKFSPRIRYTSTIPLLSQQPSSSSSTGVYEGMWAQTGYIKKRFSHDFQGISAGIHWGVYFEVSAGDLKHKPGNYHLAIGFAPSAGGHLYEVLLDKATGTWTAYYDFEPWTDQNGHSSSFQHDNWKNVTGKRVSYTAEINVQQTDMVGTVGNKCHFSDCQYKPDGKKWANAKLTTTNLSTTNPDEWENQFISSTAFDVWDVNPLP